MRVMLDTNVLISGMVFCGPERRLLEVIRRSHTLAVTDYLLAEATEVLARKFPGREGLLDALLQSFRVERLPLPPIAKVREAPPGQDLVPQFGSRILGRRHLALLFRWEERVDCHRTPSMGYQSEFEIDRRWNCG
ncbi:MAG: PIN domain-containing protein [Bacillota bacterium]